MSLTTNLRQIIAEIIIRHNRSGCGEVRRNNRLGKASVDADTSVSDSR